MLALWKKSHSFSRQHIKKQGCHFAFKDSSSQSYGFSSSHVYMYMKIGQWGKLSSEEFMLLSCSIEEDSWESLGLENSYWSWSSNTLSTWCQEPTHWKRPWCWQRLKVGGEGEDWGWNDWMASWPQWTSVWASSARWWRTGKPGVLQSMGLQRVDKTELSICP